MRIARPSQRRLALDSGAMDTRDLQAIEQDGRRIITLGRSTPDGAVPQYPSWTMTDLVVHVAVVHGRTAAVCRDLPRERIAAPRLPTGSDPFDWATDQLEQMLDALDRADPDAQVWTFGPDTRLAFWGRRMVVETGVHRWDAQDAVGRPEPLPELVARHGLDEFPDVYLSRLGDVPTIELQATDIGRAWRYGEGEPADVVLDSASSLFLRLMSRPGAVLPAAWAAAVDALPAPTD